MWTLLSLFEERMVIAVTVLSSSSVVAGAEGLIDGGGMETFSVDVVGAMSSAVVAVEDATTAGADGASGGEVIERVVRRVERDT